MGMSSDYDIDILACTRQIEVIGLAVWHIVTYMGYRHYKITPFFLQKRSCRIGCIDDVMETHSFIVLFRDKACRIHVYAHDTYLFVSDLLYDIWLEYTSGWSIRKVIIGRKPGAFHLFPIRCKLPKSVVKLMIAEYAYIIIHHIEERIFDITLEELEVKRTLHHIAGIDKNHILFRFAHGIDDSLAGQYASYSVSIRIDIGMSIVRVQKHKALCHCREAEGQSQCNKYFFHDSLHAFHMIFRILSDRCRSCRPVSRGP